MSNAQATLDIPKNPAQRRAWICYQLRLLNLSLRDLARREGVSHQVMSVAAAGFGSSHLQEALAETLGLKPQRLFPEHYDPSGKRLGRVREKKRITRLRRGNDQSEDAA